MSHITILGLGAMGARLAANLLTQDHLVTVWNRSGQKMLPLVEMGAIAAETPREAVRQADYVISMVSDDEASQQVWLADGTGALVGLKAGAIALESSTLSLEWTRQLAAHFQAKDLQAKGITFLDAPVAGSRPQAEAAQLIYFVGGEPAAFEAARPILTTLSSAVHHAGPVGNGMAIKLAVNMLLGVQAAAMGELIGFMQRCGLAAAQAVDILSATSVCSPATKALAAAMVARRFTPIFPIALMEKDLEYLVSSAQAQGANMPIGQVARQVFGDAIAQGYTADNITGVAQLYS